MNQEAVNTSSDLIRWWKMLALPAWARFALTLIMVLILCRALGLMAGGLFHGERETATSALGVLTVGLPIGRIVAAPTFGDGGAPLWLPGLRPLDPGPAGCRGCP